MTQQIIVGSFSGLSFSTGLSLGTGLYIGGGFSGIIFAGASSLTLNPRETIQEAARFSGSGILSALPSGRYLTNPATFTGAGVVSSTTTMGDAAKIALNAAGGVAATSS